MIIVIGCNDCVNAHSEYKHALLTMRPDGPKLFQRVKATGTGASAACDDAGRTTVRDIPRSPRRLL
jgi:hypothetical protein